MKYRVRVETILQEIVLITFKTQARKFSYITLFNMKKLKHMKAFYGSIFLLIALFYSSCAVVESIFKAGVWVGILIVVGIIGLIVWILSRFTKKS